MGVSLPLLIFVERRRLELSDDFFFRDCRPFFEPLMRLLLDAFEQFVPKKPVAPTPRHNMAVGVNTVRL